MPSPSFSPKSKAITIVPVVLLSGAWTVNLLSGSAVATGTHHDHHTNLPDGTSVPTKAIDSPASVPVPGVIAPGVPKGSVDQVVTGASASGIPAPALAAYQRAAQIIDTADTSCNVPWELLGAIGRVESNHGRTGGSALNAKGVAHPDILGPVLNGKHQTQTVLDTDGGRLDGNTSYDRAVGPMQFLPSTWEVVKVDADGDGQRNPQDINDAALATAVYLCSGNENLATHKGQAAAVYRYNHSHSYVNLVLRIMEAYAAGDYSAVPSGSYGGSLFSPDYATVTKKHKQHARGGKQDQQSTTIPVRGGSGKQAGDDDVDRDRPGGSSTQGPASTPTTAPGGGNGPLAPLPTPIQSALQPVTELLTQVERAAICQTGLSDLLGGAAKLQVVQKATAGLVSGCADQIPAADTKAEAAAAAPNILVSLLKALGLGGLVRG